MGRLEAVGNGEELLASAPLDSLEAADVTVDDGADNESCVEEITDMIDTLGGRLFVETTSVAVQVVSGTVFCVGLMA